MNFAKQLRRSAASLQGRGIGPGQSIIETGIPPHGMMLFFYDLNRRMGCFPYSYFKNKEFSTITYEDLEKQYADREL